MNSRFFIQNCILQAQLFQDREQVVLFLFFLLIVLILLLSLLHLISCLLIYWLLQYLHKQIVNVILWSELLNSLFSFTSMLSLILVHLFMVFDLFMTLSLHLNDLFEHLLLLAFFSVLFINIPSLWISNQLIALILLHITCYLTLSEMIVNIDLSFLKVELSFANLLLHRLVIILRE